MALLLNTQALAKSYGASFLFRNVSLSVRDGDRIGLIGPNGSGKSTLLEILAQRREADTGEVALRKGTHLAYLPQDSQFPPGETIRAVIRRSLQAAAIPEAEWQAREGETLGRAGFDDFDAEAAALSGGWRKRLAISEALVQNPNVVLFDEPTNHLDLGGIEWLEKLLRSAPFASVIVSHDRYFLENVPTAIAELNRVYPDGLLHVAGNYSAFLEKKAEFLHAQSKRQDSLENRVRTEMEWLRRGPKARATKAKARIDTAHEMIGELADLRSRSRTSATDIDFAGTERKTKRLIHLEGVAYGYEGRILFDALDFTITAGMRVGLVGSNGSGKTTLLRLLRGEMPPLRGKVERADGLRMVYFDQNRVLDPDVTLRRALAPNSDSVIYRDRVIHVAAWAARFLFSGEQLNQPVGRLSGGERARVLIANLMLEPAEVLLLDEPTNDLDIPTLEILEESLLEFPGALVLVTHDRYLLDRVSTLVLGLDGQGRAERFADYSQWDVWQEQRKQPKPKAQPEARPSNSASEGALAAPVASPAKKKPSYLEAREYESIEQRVHEAEQVLEHKQAALKDPSIARDGRLVEQAYRQMEEAQASVDAIYARWAELEQKMA
ncbi:MAG: ABC-F family ATP-binding cassette domain-containing protein [Acidobacteriota bacterium]